MRAIWFCSAQPGPPRKLADGFTACTILFCAAPLGLLGAVTDGFPVGDSGFGYFYLLAVKAVMDGLAMTGFVKMFGWPSALSAFPVFGLSRRHHAGLPGLGPALARSARPGGAGQCRRRLYRLRHCLDDF